MMCPLKIAPPFDLSALEKMPVIPSLALIGLPVLRLEMPLTSTLAANRGALKPPLTALVIR